MLSTFIKLVLLTVVPIEMCVRTIPPEEYYPTATLPETTPLTAAPVRVEPVPVSTTSSTTCATSTVTLAPTTYVVATNPGTSVPVTAASITKCTTCAISTIAPTGLPAGQTFESTVSTDAMGCKKSQVTCKRTDNQVCTSVSILSGAATIATSAGSVSATLLCDTDGTWSSGATTQITALTCQFNNCNSCTPCGDINTISPTGLPAGESFESMESTDASGCTQYQITCKRTDNQVCTSVTISSGSITLATSTGTNDQVSTTLSCQAGGTWSSGATTNVGKLTCNFNCMPPDCNTCDMASSRSTDPIPVGYSFLYQLVQSRFMQSFGCYRDTVVDGCKQTRVTCKKDAGGPCNKVGITYQTNDGPGGLFADPALGYSSDVFWCESDGTYSYFGFQFGLSDFGCSFDC